MMAALLTFLGSSAVGTIIGGVLAYFNKKQDTNFQLAKLQHELSLRDKDLELMKVEQAGLLSIAQEGTEATRFNAIATSMEADKLDAAVLEEAGWLRFLLVLTDALRRIIRPGATLALLGAALWINYIVLSQATTYWTDISADRRMEIITQCLGWVLGQASAVLTYWFVARGSVK